MPPLPPPFEWPSRRTVRLERIFAALLCCLPVGFAGVIYAAARPLFGILVLGPVLLLTVLGPVIVALLRLDGRGLLLAPVRGGPRPVIEVMPRRGGPGLVVPLASGIAQEQSFRLGVKGLTYLEAVALTSAGAVCFARGGRRLHPDLVGWLRTLSQAEGAEQPRPGSREVEEIAAVARSGDDVPAGVELVSSPWTGVRYRGRERSDLQAALFFLAGLGAIGMSLSSQGFQAETLWRFLVPPALAILYWILWAGPVTIEVEARGPVTLVRRRRFGFTLSVRRNETAKIGLDLTQLPFVALRFGRRMRGFTSRSVGGLDAAGLVWVAAHVLSVHAATR